MTHPLTPPPELVASLRNSAPHGIRDAGVTRELWLINSSYAAGADQELEACCGWVSGTFLHGTREANQLRAARRPKPPSLKEQALALLQPGEPRLFNSEMQDTLRRALEAIPDD